MRTKQEIDIATAHAHKGVVLVCLGAKVRNNRYVLFLLVVIALLCIFEVH